MNQLYFYRVSYEIHDLGVIRTVVVVASGTVEAQEKAISKILYDDFDCLYREDFTILSAEPYKEYH